MSRDPNVCRNCEEPLGDDAVHDRGHAFCDEQCAADFDDGLRQDAIEHAVECARGR